jgi:hypothetical protein
MIERKERSPDGARVGTAVPHSRRRRLIPPNGVHGATRPTLGISGSRVGPGLRRDGLQPGIRGKILFNASLAMLRASSNAR